MHVADVTMFYAPQSGGVRRYIEAKRRWFSARAGWLHSIVIPGSSTKATEDGTVALRGFALAHGYRVPLRKSPAASTLVRLRPSLIESGDPYVLAWAALEARDRLRVPAVAFCHSDLPRLVGVRYGCAAERLAALYYSKLYRQFDQVLAPSRTMTARLRAWGVTHAQHQPLGVDLEVFHPRRRDAAFRDELGIPRHSRLVVYAGRFSPEKNLDVLAQAMRWLGSPYVALLAGAGRVPRNLPDNVRVLPYVSERAALARLLASCDAFVHPGDQETFGLAALEAMACGIPVVGVQAAGIAELVSHEEGVLVRARDVRALSEGIAALYESDLAVIGANARRVAERHAWEPVLGRIAERYRALVQRLA